MLHATRESLLPAIFSQTSFACSYRHDKNRFLTHTWFSKTFVRVRFTVTLLTDLHYYTCNEDNSSMLKKGIKHPKSRISFTVQPLHLVKVRSDSVTSHMQSNNETVTNWYDVINRSSMEQDDIITVHTLQCMYTVDMWWGQIRPNHMSTGYVIETLLTTQLNLFSNVFSCIHLNHDKPEQRLLQLPWNSLLFIFAKRDKLLIVLQNVLWRGEQSIDVKHTARGGFTSKLS